MEQLQRWGLILKMLIMLELIKLENVFAYLFFPSACKTIRHMSRFPPPPPFLPILCSALLLRVESSRELTFLPPCSFLPISSSPLIYCLRSIEKSADEQLNMAFPQGGKVTPVCEDVCERMGGR